VSFGSPGGGRPLFGEYADDDKSLLWDKWAGKAVWEKSDRPVFFQGFRPVSYLHPDETVF
jgi:hypothetical protein